MKHYRNVVILLSLFFFFIISCSNQTSNQPAALSVSPSAVSLNAGDPSTIIKATLKNITGEVNWKLSPEVGTLSSTTGAEISYTPPTTVAAETTVTLTASHRNLTAKATLTITPTNPNPTGFKISGQVQDYDAGAASLEAITSAREIKVGTGNIAADGSFSITLATPADEDLLAAEKPCPEVTQTPENFNMEILSFLRVVKDGLGIGELSQGLSLISFAGYMYADRDASIIGSCFNNGFSETFDIRLKKGWNILFVQSNEDSNTFTSPENVDLPWRFSPSLSTDDIPPTVLSVEPADGEKGVREDASIVITFSEPMDQAATEAAYQSPNLPPVTFAWNAAGSVLTITPDSPIPYSYNVDEALSYSFSISGAAQDAAGNALAFFSSSFSTLRAFYTECFGIPSQDGEVRSSGTVFSEAQFIWVGDVSDDTTAHGFFSFDLSACLPEGRLLSEAVFNVYQAGTSGNPDSLGSMILEHVSYGNSLSRSVYDTPALATMGNFDLLPFTSTGRVFLDVTSAVQDDLANRATRGNRSQFRLRFTNFSNFDGNYDYVAFEAANPARSRDFVPFIQANYLIP